MFASDWEGERDCVFIADWISVVLMIYWVKSSTLQLLRL